MLLSTNYAFLFLLLPSPSTSVRPSPAYQRTAVSANGTFDARAAYFPCAPVSVHDAERDITYAGRRCPDRVGLERYSNIKYAVETPLNASGTWPFSYPGGSTVDTAFPYALCRQFPGLPYDLSYELARDVEDAAQVPLPEDCLTLSVFRPADLPLDLSGLIAPDALASTHRRGLLPVTLIMDESGPMAAAGVAEGEGDGHDDDGLDDDDDDDNAEQPRIGRYGGRRAVEANAAWIVQRDMSERGTGRIIVVANYAILDVGGRRRVFETQKAALEELQRSGDAAVRSPPNVCRTPAEFRRLSALARARNAAAGPPHAIEWPLYRSARGRPHADLLIGWIRRNIEVFGGEPGWLQEVVILPEGAMSRTTTEPEWKARRLVRQDDLDAEMLAAALSGGPEGGDSKMILNIPL